MEIHDQAKDLYRRGYRSDGGGHMIHLTDPNGNRMLYFYGDHDKPIENPVYIHNELEMRMQEGGQVPDFSPPGCQITDWLLAQMQTFGDTVDGFLCDLECINDKCKIVTDSVRLSLNRNSTTFVQRCLSEANSLCLIFVIKHIAFSCACKERFDKDEFEQFLVKLDNLCERKISNYPC